MAPSVASHMIPAPVSVHEAWRPDASTTPCMETNGAVTLDRQGRQTVLMTEGDWLFGCGDGRVHALLHEGVTLILWSRHSRHGAVMMCTQGLKGEQGFAPYDEAAFCVNAAANWLENRFVKAACGLRGAELTVLGAAKASREAVGRLQTWAHLWGAAHQLGPVRLDVGGHVSRGMRFSLIDGHLSVVRNGQMRAVASEDPPQTRTTVTEQSASATT